MSTGDHLTKDFYKKCCEEFVEITSTDIELAQDYLIETRYNLKEALDKYYCEDHVVIDGHTIRCSHIKVEDFQVISWNLEGLEKKDFLKRTNAAILSVVRSKSKIIFLQELVKENENEFRKYFQEDFDLLIDSESSGFYYCGILIKRHPNIKVLKDSFKVKRFENSKMDRNMLIVTILINDIPIKLITTHLESMGEFSNERKDQLQMAFEEMKRDTEFSIFAGDMNLRDKEIVEIGGLPPNIVDVWETTGKRKEVRFTWDPKRNLNANQYCPGAFGQRFDRMYFFSNRVKSPQDIKPVHFGLDGLEKVPLGIRFPSDHWAIVGRFLLQKVPLML